MSDGVWNLWISGSKNLYKKEMCLREIGLCAQNMLTNKGLLVNIVGGLIWPFNEHTNIHFYNKWDNHISSENYEETCYALNLDLLTILH